MEKISYRDMGVVAKVEGCDKVALGSQGPLWPQLWPLYFLVLFYVGAKV